MDEKKIEEGIQHIMSHQVSWYGCQIPDDDYDNKYYHQKEVINIARSSINWFKENLWHSMSEKPEMGSEILIRVNKKIFEGTGLNTNDCILHEYDYHDDWEHYAKDARLLSWLYIDDLLTNKK